MNSAVIISHGKENRLALFVVLFFGKGGDMGWMNGVSVVDTANPIMLVTLLKMGL